MSSEAARAEFPGNDGQSKIQQWAFDAGARHAYERAAALAVAASNNEADGYYGQACFEVAAAIRALAVGDNRNQENR